MTDGNNPQNPASAGPVYVDPQTGQPVQQPVVDPATGHAMVRATDPGTGQLVQYPVDPTTGQPVGAPVPVAAAPAAPAAAPAAPPPSQPVADVAPAAPAGSSNDAFGFNEAPVQEKYNTEYIVSTMNKDTRTTQYIVIGVVVAAILGAAMWALLMPEPEPPKLPTEQAAAAPSDAEPADADDAGADKKDAEAEDGAAEGEKKAE